MTDKPKHTPGPWKKSDDVHGVIVADSPIGTDSSDIVVEAYGANLVCDCVRSENMSLLLNVPEMYELLERIVKDYNNKDMDNDTFCDSMMDKARIAEDLLSQIKGKGQQQ